MKDKKYEKWSRKYDLKSEDVRKTRKQLIKPVTLVK